MISKKLILKDNNPKEYVVVDLDNDISFVHNNKTGKNYFNQNAISRITDLTQGRISQSIQRYNADMEDITNSNILLNVSNSRIPVKFYDFDVVTYIVYRSNNLKAIQMRKYISDSIDEKFNRDAGFTKPEQLNSLEKDVRKIIQHLKTKVWEETTLAFEAKTNQEFNDHMDLADKYAMDANKRERQLKNAINCNKRLEKRIRIK